MKLTTTKTCAAVSAGRPLQWPLLAGLLLLGNPAWAAPEEIQVYMDEVSDKGEFGLDVHLNYVPEGIKLPDYPGGQATHRVFRVTPEFSYGLTPNLELGLYVLTSRDPDGNSTVDGQKLRLKYIAPKAAGQAYFVGANLEIGKVDFRLNENPWNGELKGIFGYRKDRWTLALNTNLGFKIAGPVDSPPTLSLATKVAYKTDRDFQIGFESYNELGELARLGNTDLGQLNQTVFAVIDASIKGWDINFGVGRGFTSASDRWVLKAVVSVPFGN